MIKDEAHLYNLNFARFLKQKMAKIQPAALKIGDIEMMGKNHVRFGVSNPKLVYELIFYKKTIQNVPFF